MAELMERVKPGTGNFWRIVGWSAAAILLLTPLVAMQFTDQVIWDLSDFVIFGGLLGVVGVTFELAARWTSSSTYRAAAGVALLAAFLLVWANGAVGLIGSENNPANWMYAGVLGIGISGSFLARFRAAGMATAMAMTALAFLAVAAIAILMGMHHDLYSSIGEILGANAFFAFLFLGSALMFWNASRRDRLPEQSG